MLPDFVYLLGHRDKVSHKDVKKSQFSLGGLNNSCTFVSKTEVEFELLGAALIKHKSTIKHEHVQPSDKKNRNMIKSQQK